MIVHRTTGLAHLARKGLPILMALFAWDVFVLLVYQLAHRSWMDQPALPYSLVGSALVLFLNMRNNAAYSRWWEARTLWGAIINNTRSFSRQCATWLGDAPNLNRAMVAYAYALRASLGGLDAQCDIERLAKPLTTKILASRNRPNALLLQIGLGVRDLVEERTVDAAAHASIDRILSDLANAQGGLERIRNTPLAIQFSVLPRLLVQAFCLVLPLSMVQDLGWITPLGSTVVGFLFLAFDEIGLDLENPFQEGPNALPMLAMARTIEIDLMLSIGEDAPDALQPESGILR
jgi:putative membrane protein